MKNEIRTDKAIKTDDRNAKAAELLRSLDDAALEEVSGGNCRTCGLIITLDAQLKAVK